MCCIIEFFNDEFQRKLKRLCQLNSERYEDSLERYKKSFISELSLTQNKRDIECSECKMNSRREEICSFIMLIKQEEIVSFFDKIKEIYINWINSKSQDSFKIMEELISEYRLMESKIDIKDTIFFRARKSKDILTIWDMFHIPFNKRYLISNQRYSLSGQPLLYLGVSVLDIVNELNGDFDSLEDYTISTFQFKETFQIIDLKNKFSELLSAKTADELLELSEKVDGQNKNYLPKNEELKAIFFEYILVNCCCFEKRKEHYNYTFCEEYVLPQILAQVLKKKEIKGIMYSSSKNFKGVKYNDYNTFFKNNIAIFTNFNQEHIYDRDLFNQLVISNPISIQNMNFEVSIDKINTLCDQIKVLDKKIERMKLYYNIGEQQKYYFDDIQVNDKPILEVNIGKMQLALVYNFLHEKRNQCLLVDE